MQITLPSYLPFINHLRAVLRTRAETAVVWQARARLDCSSRHCVCSLACSSLVDRRASFWHTSVGFGTGSYRFLNGLQMNLGSRCGWWRVGQVTLSRKTTNQ